MREQKKNHHRLLFFFMLWVGQAAFPVNHESIPLLLSFGGPILLCRPNYHEGWKSRPFAPHIPLPPMPSNYTLHCTSCNILLQYFLTPVKPPRKNKKGNYWHTYPISYYTLEIHWNRYLTLWILTWKSNHNAFQVCM